MAHEDRKVNDMDVDTIIEKGKALYNHCRNPYSGGGHAISIESLVLGACQALEQLQDDIKRLEEDNRWIPISEGPPENLKRVVVAYKNSLGKLRITIAEYIQPRSILAEEYLSEDCPIQFAESDYDKSKDCYWTPSGWYESTYHGEINLYIRETIICWMPIPIIPSKP